MKKFFSILCAIAIVFSANATSISKKDVIAKNVVKKELRVKNAAVKAPAKAAHFKTLKSVSVKKVATVKELNAPKHELANAPKAVAKAPQAKKATVDLTFTSADAEIDWYDYCATEGWWQIEAETDEWYVSLSNVASDEAAGEYAWEDLDPEYCCVYDIANESGFIYFVGGSCTVAVAEDGSVNVSGSFADEAGNIYNIDLTYEEPEAPVYPEGGEFECDEVSFSYYASDGDAWYKLDVAEPEMEFRFDVLVGEGLEDVELDKEYTLDDMIANYTYVYLGENKLTFTEVSFLKSSNVDGSADLNVVAKDENGNVWKLHYAFPAAPEALSFETITANVTYTKEAYWFWYVYTFEAADEANAIVLQIMPDDSFYGTWSAGENADITGAVAPLNGVESEIYSGEVTIEQNAKGFKITGKVLCWNSIEYTLDLTYVIPAATREADFTLANLEANIFDGGWQLMGFNADSTEYISIAAYADEVAGHYTEAELAGDYCYIYTGLEFDEEGNVAAGTQFTLLKADLDVAFNEEAGTITITGKFRAQNGDDAADIPEFKLNLSGAVPEPISEEVTFAMKDMKVTFTEEYWDIKGSDEETGYYLEIRSLTPEVAGTYTEANLDDYWTYVGTGNSTFFDIKEANVTVAFADNVLTVKGTMTFANGSDLIVATVDVAGDAGAGDEYDAQDEDFKFVFEEYTIDDQYFVQYGVLVVEAKDEDNNYISLEIETETAELTAGVYTVGQEVAKGYIEDNSIYGSFAGVRTAQGINIPLWLINAGTVTVYENGPIAVSATNTWGRQIECLLGTWPEAIDNTDANATVTKSIKNGQLIIRKNGVDYNAQGAIVK